MADVAAAQPDDLLKAASAPGAANGAAAWLDGFADADRPRSASGGSTADESEVPSGWTGTPTDKEQKRRWFEKAKIMAGLATLRDKSYRSAFGLMVTLVFKMVTCSAMATNLVSRLVPGAYTSGGLDAFIKRYVDQVRGIPLPPLFLVPDALHGRDRWCEGELLPASPTICGPYH